MKQMHYSIGIDGHILFIYLFIHRIRFESLESVPKRLTLIRLLLQVTTLRQ